LDSAVSIQNHAKAYLAETGRKKKWLAAQLGITPAALSQWLTGKTAFSSERLQDVLNIIQDNP